MDGRLQRLQRPRDDGPHLQQRRLHRRRPDHHRAVVQPRVAGERDLVLDLHVGRRLRPRSVRRHGWHLHVPRPRAAELVRLAGHRPGRREDDVPVRRPNPRRHRQRAGGRHDVRGHAHREHDDGRPCDHGPSQRPRRQPLERLGRLEPPDQALPAPDPGERRADLGRGRQGDGRRERGGRDRLAAGDRHPQPDDLERRPGRGLPRGHDVHGCRRLAGDRAPVPGPVQLDRRSRRHGLVAEHDPGHRDGDHCRDLALLERARDRLPERHLRPDHEGQGHRRPASDPVLRGAGDLLLVGLGGELQRRPDREQVPVHVRLQRRQDDCHVPRHARRPDRDGHGPVRHDCPNHDQRDRGVADRAGAGARARPARGPDAYRAALARRVGRHGRPGTGRAPPGS